MAFWGNRIVIAFVVLMAVMIVIWQYSVYRKVPQSNKDNQSVAVVDQLVKSSSRDSIPAINNPQFESVALADTYLNENGYGIDVNVNGAHRFYPYQILVWHEIVNDYFGGKALAVTYDPLCFYGIVFERSAKDSVLNFGVSEFVWNNSLILFDRETNALWSQLLGKSISAGALDQELVVYPSSVVTWNEWKTKYPRGAVLSRNTGFNRDYSNSPYGEYETNADMYFSLSDYDVRLKAKDKVLSLIVDGKPTAYTLEKQKDAPETATPIFWGCWSGAYPETAIFE